MVKMNHRPKNKERNCVMGLSAAAPWLRHYGNTPETLSYPSASMYQLVRRTAEQYPNKTAYVFMGKRTGYAQFLERIENTAKGLYAIGIRKADRVTICMPNMPQAVDCFYALNQSNYWIRRPNRNRNQTKLNPGILYA